MNKRLRRQVEAHRREVAQRNDRRTFFDYVKATAEKRGVMTPTSDNDIHTEQTADPDA